MKKGTLIPGGQSLPPGRGWPPAGNEHCVVVPQGRHEAYGVGTEAVMIEPRKFDDCQGPADRVRRDSTGMPVLAMGISAGSGSESRAEVHVGIPGTCESLPFPEETRNGVKPSDQHPGPQSNLPRTAGANIEKESGCRCSSLRQEWREETAGSLSRFIVANESRETLLGRSL
ncbi:MAG: hypothetical protein K9N52_04265 [Verrucomicrobia bacterium]|nr:hypothetical protein [Verrucomicrobiota bacterium]